MCLLTMFSSCNKTNVNANVDLTGKIVAVEANSLSLSATEVLKSDVFELREFSTLDGAVSAVESKEVDYVVMSEFEVAQYIENKRKIKSVKELNFTTEFCAYFCDNADLLNNFNSIILDLIENGTIEEIKNSYKSGEVYYPTLVKLSGDVPTLTIATDIVGYPYTDLTEDGSVVGMDIDIATIVANKLGCNLEIIVVPVDEAFKLLEKGDADFIISGLMYEAERMTSYQSSFSYLTEKYYLICRD